jgi:general secretion pathway protein M
MSLKTTLGSARARWQALDVREQSMVRTAALVIGAALFWWIGIAPALNTLKEARAQQRTLAADLEKMQRLRAQAQAIQSQPKMDRAESVRALEALVKQRLGASAQLSVIGDRATVTLRNTPAGELAQWLSQARVNARAVPNEVRLTRSAAAPAPANAGAPPNSLVGATTARSGAPAAPPAAAAAAPGTASWDGTLVLGLAPQ